MSIKYLSSLSDSHMCNTISKNQMSKPNLINFVSIYTFMKVFQHFKCLYYGALKFVTAYLQKYEHKAENYNLHLIKNKKHINY